MVFRIRRNTDVVSNPRDTSTSQLYFDSGEETEFVAQKHVSNDKEEYQTNDDEENEDNSSDVDDVDKSEERTHFTVKKKLLVKPH